MTRRVKEAMTRGQAVNGCWIELFSPLVAEIVAHAGYDSVLIDLEHGQGAVLDAISIMQAVQGLDCAALLRVPSNDPVWLKRVLDAGVDGVMVPAVNDAGEAAAAVAACRYPPKGVRGMAATLVRASRFGLDWQDYVARSADELLIMCQVESAQAVENVSAIAGVEGVDMLFIGPFDLSTSLGFLGQPDHETVMVSIAKVEAAAKAAGKLLGGIPTPGRSAQALYDAGYHLVIADADTTLLRDAAGASVESLRAAAGRSD